MIFLSFAYVSWWVFARDAPRARARSPQQRVRFEAIWGMCLALPLPWTLLVLTSRPDAPAWHAMFAVVASMAFYAVPVLAICGLRLSAAVRWIPLVVAAAGLPVVPAWVFPQVAWSTGLIPSWSDVGFLFASGIGIAVVLGYFADCLVAIRFARAVAKRDAAGGEDPRGLPVSDSTPGAGWRAVAP